MWGGTGRRGLTAPGRTRRAAGMGARACESWPRWHFLYLFPLPHQQGSLGPGSFAGGARVVLDVLMSVLSPSGAAGAPISTPLETRGLMPFAHGPPAAP